MCILYFLGGVLGTVLGGVALLILKASNTTMDELRNHNSKWTDFRLLFQLLKIINIYFIKLR